MTGFARSSVAVGSTTVTIEVRSVNSRFLDIHFKLPDGLRRLEPALRARLSKTLARGKVELMVRSHSEGEGTGIIDEQRLDALIRALATVQSKLGGGAAVDPLALLMAPGVLGDPQSGEDQLTEAVLTAAQHAIDDLSVQRQNEGDVLARLTRERAARLRELLASLRHQLPALRDTQRQRIIDRIRGAGIEADSKRLEEELVYMAQRADVDEEMDRIDAHLDAIEAALSGGEPCGRRLDFLMQELNREANTLSSKATALTTTNTAVEFKLLIEQMREQIQNIE